MHIFYTNNQMRVTIKSWNKFTIKSNNGIIMQLIYNILNTNNDRKDKKGGHLKWRLSSNVKAELRQHHVKLCNSKTGHFV